MWEGVIFELKQPFFQIERNATPKRHKSPQCGFKYSTP